MPDSASLAVGRPRPHVGLHFLDDESVLFDQAAQRLYALNTGATFIWCCLEEQMPLEDVTAKMRDTFALAPNVAGTYVDDILKQWSELGLLDSGPIPVDVPKYQGPTEYLPADRVASAPPPVASHWLRLLGLDIELRIASSAAARKLRPLLAPLLAPARDAAPLVLDLIPDGKGFLLHHQGKILIRSANASGLAPALKVALLFLVLEHSRDFGALHSAAVGRNGHCVVFPGMSGAGKSTLTAGLLAAGFEILGDDTIVLTEGEIAARPIPYGVCLKDGAVPVVASRFPQVGDLPVHDRADGKRVRYLVPGAGHRADVDGIYDIRALLYLRRETGIRPERVPLSRAESLYRLMEGFVPLQKTLDQPHIERLVDWIGKVDCYELRYTALDDGVAMVAELL